MPVTLSPSVLRVFLASLDTPSLFLPLRLADSGVRISPTRSADSSVSLLRPVRVLFLATAVSFSIASDCVYVSFIRLPLFFFLPHSLTLSPFFVVSVPLVPTNREIRSNTRGDVPSTLDTLCSASEGSVRRFHGEVPFSASASSLFLTHGNTLAPYLFARQ